MTHLLRLLIILFISSIPFIIYYSIYGPIDIWWHGAIFIAWALSVAGVFAFFCIHSTSVLIRAYFKTVLERDEPDWSILTHYVFGETLPYTRFCKMALPLVAFIADWKMAVFMIVYTIVFTFLSSYMYKVFKNGINILCIYHIIEGTEKYLDTIPQYLPSDTSYYLLQYEKIKDMGFVQLRSELYDKSDFYKSIKL